MKRITNIALLFLLALGVSNLVQAQVEAYVLSHMGQDGPSTLYQVDLTNGMSTPIGPVGFERCGAMEIDPATGIAYATCERIGSSVPVLITINLTTGAGTEVGPTGLNGAIGDISFRDDGTLFVYDATNDPQHTIYTANTSTGAGTLVGETGLSFNGGNAMTFHNGTLYHLNFDACNTINPNTGMATPYGVPNYVDSGGRMAAMDVNPATNTIYGVLKIGSVGGQPIQLVTYDPLSCDVTVVGPLPNGADGIAIYSQPPAIMADAIPTLSQWGLFLFGLVFATLGLVLVYRSQKVLAGQLHGGMQMNMRQIALPFDKELFKRCMTYAIGIGILGFGIIQIGWGEILPLDVVGVTISIPVIAYAMHVVGMMRGN